MKSLMKKQQCFFSLWRWSFRFVSSSLSDKKLYAGESLSVTVLYSSKDAVKTIKAFVLDPVTMSPLIAAWTKAVAS